MYTMVTPLMNTFVCSIGILQVPKGSTTEEQYMPKTFGNQFMVK
jgi:hypothetical protein